MSMDQRLKYFEDRISSSLKPRGEELRRVFSNETIRNIFVDFLCNSECRCLFTSCNQEGLLTVSLKPPVSNLEKSVAFLKCKHVSKVSQDTMEDVLYVEFAGQPLDNLQLLLREVFLPLACLSGPEDGGFLDKLLDVLHCILGSVEVLSHHTKGHVVLPQPSLEVLADVSSNPGRHGGVMHVLETCIVTWLKQIKHALQCSPNTWMTTVTQFPGVLDERQYWKTRLTTLTSIREQLSSLLALTILSHLEEAHSSYSGAFGQVYKDVDKSISECQLALMFLNTLHPWVVQLKNANDAREIMRTIPPLMRTVFLIWMNSQFYGENTENLERLLSMVSNDVIAVSKGLLPHNLFTETETSLSSLSWMLTVCACFRGSYLDCKAKAELQTEESDKESHAVVTGGVDRVGEFKAKATWPVWSAQIFHKLNAFMERCNDLHEVTSTVIHFHELRPWFPDVQDSLNVPSGEIHPHQTLIYEGFEEALKSLTESQQDMLDLEEGSGTFESCFFTFRSKVKVLEVQASQLLCELWDNSDTMFSKLRVLELFHGLCSRESIQVKLAERCKNLLSDLNEDMVQNQAVLQCFSENPPLLKDIPPTASALFWLQGFKQRVKITLDRLQPLIPDLLASDDGWKLRDMQKKLLSQVERLEQSCFEKWEVSTPHNLVQDLEQPVLQLKAKSGIAVNISQLFLLTLKEVKYIIQTAFKENIPQSVISLVEKCKDINFSSKLNRLSAMVQEYNSVQQSLTEEEKALLQHRLVRIEALLEDGSSKVTWLSSELEEFISVVTILISGDFVPRVQSIQDIQQQVKDTVLSWEKARDSDAFNVEGKGDSVAIENLIERHRETCERLENCLATGMKKISCLMEDVFCLTEASQDSPVWSEFVDQVDGIILGGLKNAFLSAIGSLLQRVLLYEQGYSITPLVSVKLELLQHDVSFVPALDSLTSDPSIPETVKTWLTDYLQACGQAKSWRKDQQGHYYDVLSSDTEISSAVSKVSAHLETSARQCRSLRNKFLSYSFMWEDDVEESFELFLKGQYAPYERHLLTRPQTVRASARSTHGGRPGSTRPATATTMLSSTMGMSDWTFIYPESTLAESSGEMAELNLPTLDDFDMQIAVFEGFVDQLNNINDCMTVGWLMVNVRPVKHVLQSLVSKWKYQFTHYLATRVCNVLETLNEFLCEVEPQVDMVTGSEDDWEYIKTIISVFNKVTTKAQEMDGKFGAVHRTVKMLHKYGHMIPSEAARFLSAAPQRWSSLKKKIGIAKQRVSPKVQANSKLVIQDLKLFSNNFHTLVEDFEGSPCLVFETPIKVAVECLTEFRDRLSVLQGTAKDLEVIQELLEKNVFNFSKLSDFAQELDTLEKLLDKVTLFTAQHSDWKCHKWCDVDTTILMNATAVQQDQLRNLPQFCSEWDVFMRLSQEVTEIQSTLPIINDLLRPSLRPRHWKQVIRLAIPRKSASRSSKTKASEIKRFTLGELMNLSLHSHATEIRSVAERADKDLAIELAIKTFEEVWLSRVFDLRPLKSVSSAGNKLVEASDDITDPPSSRPLTAFTTPALSSMAELPTRDCNVLENAEEVSDTVSEHQTSLQALLGTSSASSFMEDLNKWRKILQTIEAVLKLWMSVQDLWCLLREIYLSDEIKERLPGPALNFSGVDQEYSQLMKQVEKNSNVMHQCLKEGQLSKLEKMYASLNTCRLHLLEYTRSHQERCPWFLFLPSDDVLRFICQSSSDSTFLSSSVYKIVPTIHSLGLGWSNIGEEISEVIGCNGDVLTLDNAIPLDAPFEDMLKSLFGEISSTIHTAITSGLQQNVDTTELDVVKLKKILLEFLEQRHPHQVVLVISWTVITLLVHSRGSSPECREQLSQLIDFVSPLQKLRPDESMDKLRGSAGNGDGSAEWAPWQIAVLRDIVLVLLYYRDMLTVLDQNSRSDFLKSFQWFSSLKYNLPEEEELPVLECGGATLTYGLQYTGPQSSLLLSPQSEKCLFSMVQAVNSQTTALCLGGDVTSKQDTFFTLSKLSGRVPYSFVCSNCTRFEDISDVIVATARTGSWLFVQGITSLCRNVCISTLNILHSVVAAVHSQLAEVKIGPNVVSVEGSPFFAVSTESPLGAVREGGFCIPPHQAMQYRCVSFTAPHFNTVLRALLTAAGFTNHQSLLDNITTVVTSLPLADLVYLRVTPKMLQEVVNLATKHQDMLMNTGSLTSLYTDNADYLRVYSETYLQKRTEEVPASSEVPLPSDLESGLSNMPEKGPSTEPSSSLPPGVSSSVAPKEVHSETDALGESHQKEKTQQAGVDNSLLLTEQFAVMLALKDSFLPAFGGAHTELGKKFVNVLGNVFTGLSVDKVITEEMDVLQKAKSTVSHIDMIDSLRESRAGSSLGRALSPAVKVPINLEEAIVGACRMLELEPTLSFQSNVIQFIQLVQAHKMIVVAGPPCCGKTACATVGAEALRLLGYSVLYTKVNLNQGPQSSLTGTWDTTSQWKDGILYSVLEEILLRLVSKKESPEEPQWLIIDGPCSTQDLLRIIHPDGLLRVPNKKVIKLPTELKIIVESSNPTESSVPVILMSSVDIGWEAMLKVEMKRAKVGKLVQSILRKAVSEVIDFLNATCTSPEQLAVLTFKLFQGLVVRSKLTSTTYSRLATLYAVAWVAKYFISSSDHLSEKWDQFLQKQLDDIGTPLSEDLAFYECGLDYEKHALVQWKYASNSSSDPASRFIHTPVTQAYNDILAVAIDQCIPVLLRGELGSGKTSFVLGHLQTYSSSPVGDVKSIIINLNELSTPSSLVNRLLQHMTWRAGHTYVPSGAKKLICLLDDAYKVLKSPDGQGILEILRQHVMEGGFHHPDNHQWYCVSDVSYIVISDSKWEFDPRLLRRFLVLDWTGYSGSDMQYIFMQTMSEVTVDLAPTLTSTDVVQKIVDVSLDLHKQVQHIFQGKSHSSALFSFCDLAHMFQRIRVSLERVHTLEDLLLLWQHESYWTYAAKLSTDADVARYLDTFGMSVKKQFSNIPMTEFLYGHKHCVLSPPVFSTQPSLVQLNPNTHDMLVKYLADHMAEVQKTTPIPTVIFCTQMVEEICHLVNVLNGDYSTSHVLLVGHSNPEPMLSVVAHINQLKVVRLSNLQETESRLPGDSGANGLSYDVQRFRHDIINLCNLTGAKGERLLLYISSEDIQDTFSFLVYLEELINNCSIAHLFTDEEKSHAINLIRGNVKQAGMEFSVEVAWKFFISNIKKNLRIVLSATNIPPHLLSRIAGNHPSLLRIVNLVSHRPWTQSDLLEVAELHLKNSNLNLTSKEKKQLSHMLSSMHLSLLDQPAQLPSVNNWTYKYFVERYSSELEVSCEKNSKQTLKFSEAISSIEDAEEELDSLKKTLEQETEQLEEKKYACIKLLGQTGQDTAIAGEHEKFLSRLKEQIHHLEKVLPEYYHAYEVSVGKVAQLTSDTKKLVENMDKQCLTELRGQHSPSKEVEMLLSAVIIVVKSPNADLTWTKGAKRLMANIERFLEMLSSFDETGTPSDVLLSNLEPYLNQPALELSFHEEEGSLNSVLDICQWINNVISYHQMLETKVKPLKNKLDSMNQFMEDLKKRLVAWNDKMLAYNERLNGMRISFEELSVDKCLYEEHVQAIKKQLTDITTFVQLLSDIKGIWTTEILENRDAHSLHFGSLAFVVGYVVYLAKVPPYTRDMCLQHLWPQCLRSCGVHLTWPKIAINGINFLGSPPAPSPNSQHHLNEEDEEETSPCMELTIDRMYLSMATHLMEVSELLLLLEEGWTGKEILDYLVISTSWRQSVIIIDPEEVAVKWMTRLHGTEMTSMDGRQVDREFLHSLEVALTTGQPTHIHHMGPEIDPVLMAIVEFSKIASGNAGVYIHFCGKRVSVHSNFRLYLSTSMPLDKLDTKLISSATVLDLSLYKNEMVQYLASNKFSDGSTQTTEPVETKALLERYFQNMNNVMELLKTSEQSRYCDESVLSSLEEQIHELKENQRDMSTLNTVSNTPNILSMDHFHRQTLLLYLFTTLLATTNSQGGISLCEWNRLFSQHMDRQDDESDHKLKDLVEGVLALGTRVFDATQWNILFAGCTVLCSNCYTSETLLHQPLLQLLTLPEIPLRSDDQQLHFSPLLSLLKDLVSKEPSKPILMIHEEGSFFSDIVRCYVESALELTCKEKEFTMCKLDLSLPHVDIDLESLSLAHCVFMDVGQTCDQDLTALLGKIRRINKQGCVIFMLCECSQLSLSVVYICEIVRLGNLRLSETLDLHPGESERVLAIKSPLEIMRVLLSLSCLVLDSTPKNQTCSRLVFNVCAVHAHATFLAYNRQDERCSPPLVTQFLHCLRQIKYYSSRSEVSDKEIRIIAEHVQEVYSLCASDVEGIDVCAYVSSLESVQVGNHSVTASGDGALMLPPTACLRKLGDAYQSISLASVKGTLENILPVVLQMLRD